MYRINLYPEGKQSRLRRAESVRSSALLALVGGANLVFLGFFALIGLNLRGQAEAAEARVRSLRGRLTQSGAAPGQAVINKARLLLERRASRPVWSIPLGEFRTVLPNELIVERLECTMGSGAVDVFSGMQVFGRLRSGRDVDPVVACINRLAARPVYRAQFAPGKLERVDNSQDVTRFVIACPLLRPAGSDSAGEGAGG